MLTRGERARRHSVLPVLLLLLPFSGAFAQRMNEAAAKEAVHRIVRYSGLTPTFVVIEDDQVRTAVAYIKGKDRVIAYNPVFITAILDSSHTDWSAVSILAHEIAHHLLGHTLDPEAVHPGDELACDSYSGFVLQRMGVAQADAIAAMEVAGNVHGTRQHPPRHARVAAISQGWEEGERQALGTTPLPFAVARSFQYVVAFVGDRNTYYVDEKGCLVWFNDHAEPIEFGACTRLPQGDPVFELTWQDLAFSVDRRNIIWRRTAHGMPMQVGRMEPYAR